MKRDPYKNRSIPGLKQFVTSLESVYVTSCFEQRFVTSSAGIDPLDSHELFQVLGRAGSNGFFLVHDPNMIDEHPNRSRLCMHGARFPSSDKLHKSSRVTAGM